jgi:hypothetical protein
LPGSDNTFHWNHRRVFIRNLDSDCSLPGIGAIIRMPIGWKIMLYHPLFLILKYGFRFRTISYKVTDGPTVALFGQFQFYNTKGQQLIFFS